MDAPPRYELLGPARRAKLNKEQNAAEKRTLLTLTCAMVSLTVFIISAGIAVIVLLESGWSDSTFQQLALTAKASKVNSAVDLKDVCDSYSNDSFCVFAPKLYASNCEAYTCKAFYWRVSSFAHKLGIFYQTKSIIIRPPDGTPCGPRKWCFQGQCIPSYSREIAYKISDENSGLWFEDKPNNFGCFQFTDEYAVKNLLSDPPADKCPSNRYQLKLRLFRCDSAKGTLEPCLHKHLHNFFGWNLPLLFSFPAKSTCVIPGTQETVKQLCGSHYVEDQAKEIGCKYKCNDADEFKIFTDPIECRIGGQRKGHCFHGVCIPRVIAY
ncbi:hypothetical protein T4B_1031 [Trichinella pseudospiralis]|uniref:Uncharacterized protein n=2 Tax=Trichinella pseudospiralis TaxID=6337 RepID=A0A0V1EHN7_TRIPS|nr:hypothetical protein T4E_9551 [Trichinella pseudospiralis]KRY73333.1 hypothetical protein T4A_10616 [Trichinella pseudospiralis]KRY90668.1 hypothetical protein T4D_15193 [Trichinella pseudospiralis]KRZ21185.1 hypothetical protein T4B_1031 [Trichinella pseudospiralis]KRZ38842.1 hypothetical protein T4C_7792 [Trichinella pseudospiralis]